MNMSECPSLQAAHTYCSERLFKTAQELENIVKGPSDNIAVFAVGSYGRHEAAESVSDFEWITVYDDALVGVEEARRYQADLTGYFASVFGRKFLSINKTFGETCSISDLCTNVGGEADTNRTLTYRMLVLAEGTALKKNCAHTKIIQSLAATYASSFTAGHRMLSLATDIARYWRTLRIDYKFKVDEGKKPWAVRSMKLRSSRRVWYLASAMHFVAFGPRIDYSKTREFDLASVAGFMSQMGGNPVLRMLASAEKLAADPSVLEKLLSLYDAIHLELNDETLRSYLDTLDGSYRFDDPRYESVHSKCVELHRTAATLILTLPDEVRREFLEMFLL